MYVKKFLQQVHRKLNEQGITNAKLRDTCIDIYEGENEIFKIDINTDTKKFIGEELGIILYKLLSEKFTPEYLRHEMNRYIGESRNREESTKELFKEYFYQVVLYKGRNS